MLLNLDVLNFLKNILLKHYLNVIKVNSYYKLIKYLNILKCRYEINSF